jgi:hypothetical protein
LLLVTASIASWLGCVDGLAGVVAHFGPVLLLLGAFACGLYPGEVALARLRRRAPVRRLRAATFCSPRRVTERVAAFRARLLAYHLAVRPPPGGGAAVA